MPPSDGTTHTIAKYFFEPALWSKELGTRETRYYREPKKPNMTRETPLTLDFLDLAHANISEAGATATGVPVTTFVSMFDAFLTSNSLLTWQGRGPGMGRELRRSYSNIHGRIFARSYLEKFEKVQGLLPIEGNDFQFGHDAVVHLREDENGDMPDWIGWSATNYIVAEAKGTYDSRNWERAFWDGYAFPQCLQKAQEQVARVQIDLYDYAIDVGFKGWAVASRWATEDNGLKPWLAAINPKLGSEPVDPERFRSTAAKMQREFLERMIATFGFSDGIRKISGRAIEIKNSGDFQPHRDLWRQLVLSENRKVRGLSAAYVCGAFLPIQNYEDIAALTQMFSDETFLWAATILESPLSAAEKGVFLSDHEEDSSDSFLSRNGLAIADLRTVREVHPI